MPSRATSPHKTIARTSPLLALKDGYAILEGYSYVVRECPIGASTGRDQTHNHFDTMDLCTPPKGAVPSPGDLAGNAKNTLATRWNLTRTLNRMAQSAFAKEMKDSLASGRSSTIKLTEETIDLKARCHAIAKKVAYKLLDLKKKKLERVHRV